MTNQQLKMDFSKPQESPRAEAKIISINSSKNQLLTNKVLSFERPRFENSCLKANKKS